jgi:hypothetical protein
VIKLKQRYAKNVKKNLMYVILENILIVKINLGMYVKTVRIYYMISGKETTRELGLV